MDVDRNNTPSPSKPQDRSVTRTVNAVVAGLVTVVFVGHACLSTARAFWAHLPGAPALLMWMGVGVILIHMVISIATTYDVWTSTEHPASRRKKRHHILKWITGGTLALAVVAHQLFILGVIPAGMSDILMAATLVATAILLCTHLVVSTKSLTSDLGLSSRLRTPLRVMFIVATAAVCIAQLCSIG